MANNLVINLALKDQGFKKQIDDAKKDVKLLKSEFDNASAGSKDFEKSLDGQNAKLTKLKGTLEATKKQSEVYQEQINKSRQSIESLTDKINKQTDVIDETKKKIEEATTTYGKNSDEVKKLKEELEKQEKTLSSYQRTIVSANGHMKDMETQLNNSQAEMKRLEEDVENTEKAIKDFGNTTKTSTEKLEEFGNKASATGQKITKVGDTMVSAGKTITAGLTVPIVGLGAASIKAGIDFESAFAGVRKTVDATEEEFAMLEKGILDMSRVMPQSAIEIAKVAEAAGQLGIKTENLLDFTKTMVMLGDTTNLSSEQAAMSLAKFMNIMGTNQNQVDKLGSAIVDLGNNFATTEADIVEMSTRLASAARIAGFTETQTLALAAAMSSVGIESEAGGTAMAQTLNAIEKAVANASGGMAGLANVQADANKKAEAYNKSLAEFNGQLSKSGDNSAAVKKALNNVSKAQIDYNDAVKKYGEESSQAQKKLLSLNNAQISYQSALDKSGVSLQKYSDKVTKAKSEMDLAKEAVNNFTASASDMDMFAKVAGMSADQFANAWKSSPMTALQSFINGLGKIEERGGNVVITLDDLGLSGIRQSNMLKSLSLASEMLGDSIDTANKAWQENNALTEEARKRNETFAARLEMMKNGFTAIGVSIKKILLPFMESFMDKANGIVEWLSNMSDAQLRSVVAMAALVAAIGPVIIVMGTIVKNIGILTDGFGKLALAISEAGSFGAWFSTAIAPVLTTIGAIIAIVAVVALSIKENWDGIKKATDDLLAQCKPLFDDFLEAFSELWKAAVDIYNTVIKPLFRFIGEVIEHLIILATPVLKFLLVLFTDIMRGLVKIWESVGKPLFEIMGMGFKILQEVFEPVFNSMKDLFTKNVEAIQGVWSTILAPTFGLLIDIMGVIFETIKPIYEFFAEPIIAAMKAVITPIQTVIDTVRSLLGWVGDAMRALGNLFKKKDEYREPAGPVGGGGTGTNVETRDMSTMALSGSYYQPDTPSSMDITTKSLNLKSDNSELLKAIKDLKNNDSKKYDQTINIYSPTPLNPIEVARQTKLATRKMILGV